MDPQPDDLTGTDDLTLVHAARSGDRLAFGVLYLRHHASAWRIACVVSKFSPDAELAVIEGFTRVFSALPVASEELEADGVTFRPYLLACVRQAALHRARTAGRAEPGSPRRAPGRAPASPRPPAPLTGLTPDGEVVLSAMEHHIARGALAALPERARTALWLSEVEAMTPGEVAAILGTDPKVASALAVEARAGVRAAQNSAHGRHEVRAGCRFTADHLSAYHAGTLDPKKGVLVRSHLDLCPPCRMRLGELTNAPATLAAAVPAAPLLGGEAQHHWLASAPEIRPAERLLPPCLAAAVSARSIPATVRPARDHRTRRVAGAAGAASLAVRRVGRRAWPAVPALTLAVAWLGVTLSFPQLMEPETAPAPDKLALPAVRAYVPGFLPGAARPGADQENGARSSLLPPAVGSAAGGSELAAQMASRSERAGAAGPGSGVASSNVALTPASRSGAGGPRPGGTAPSTAPATGIPQAVPAVVANVVPVVPPALAAPTPAPVPAPESKPRDDFEKPERKVTPAEKEARQTEKEARQTEKEARQIEKEARKAEKAARRAGEKAETESRQARNDATTAGQDSDRTARTARPASRGRIVSA